MVICFINTFPSQALWLKQWSCVCWRSVDGQNTPFCIHLNQPRLAGEAEGGASFVSLPDSAHDGSSVVDAWNGTVRFKLEVRRHGAALAA
jgi:hypothetical protein